MNRTLPISLNLSLQNGPSTHQKQPQRLHELGAQLIKNGVIIVRCPKLDLATPQGITSLNLHISLRPLQAEDAIAFNTRTKAGV
ncbi:uncharacterized protein CTHT_0039410 [Thermochaetoides thermophila DSM 1495]|uniref:Uncharacterized protein n=1 Tax=Chaetomium thermophilum (strain DSM 1495 / CBS 144.50 / IMI 039719) TaxID=759272 RepID=G0S498_CHATD|nr:hypothetical protein CTHT_0039410 [Thermochaetoides thermophila DSM 1495]EGS22056.1 hypothetical protein CTHT_0039410 [Thermochaetoides thermophila DSM 1495]